MRYAICNETFGDWDHPRICSYIASLGYTGLEIAPFTLATTLADVSSAKRSLLKQQAHEAGIEIIGLHWLLAKTTGYHVTHPDADVRKKTSDYFIELARLCHDLGGNLMVFGSPLQRNRLEGVSEQQAWDYAVETISAAMPSITDLGVYFCLEPLWTSETNFLNTAAEGVRMMRDIGHPHCQLHLDVKAMCGELQTTSDGDAVAKLITQYLPYTRHFHANDPNKRGPGFGDVQFEPILTALEKGGYNGWVSVEVFDYTPNPETIAEQSLRTLRRS